MASRFNRTVSSRADEDRFPLTDGVLAINNLHAQIAGLEQQLQAGLRAAIADQAELVELIALRGYLLGVIADYELAEARAEDLCRNHPEDAAAYLSRARSRARFHHFAEALADLDEAARLGADSDAVGRERATAFQALGEFDVALAFFERAAKTRRDFATLGALAVLHAERNDCAAAEGYFHEGRKSYRGVSPIPLAMLEFQRGHMWMSQRDLDRARFWFQMTVDRLPGFSPAEGHLAEVEAMCGETDRAIERLVPLASTSDDPDYMCALARVFRQTGRSEEAGLWRAKAAARYDDLIARREDAFADHAAAFLLEDGSNPERALSLAKRNLEVRRTPRARRLFEDASRACEAEGLSHSAPSKPSAGKDPA